MSRNREISAAESVLDVFRRRIREDSALRADLFRELRGLFEDERREARDEIRLSETNDLPDL